MRVSMIAVLTLAVALVFGASNANAAIRSWDGDTNNDYGTSTNWNPDGYAATDDLTVSSGTPMASINATVEGPGSLTINGGDVTWSGRFNTIGNVVNGASTLITSGSLTVDYALAQSHSFNIGNVATAVFQQQGGTVTAANSNDQIFMGNQAAGNGTYEISGGTLNAGRLYNGNAGTGLFHIIGDAATINLTGSAGTSYSQNASSTLELDINGISVIDAGANVSLAGTLDVEFLVTPTLGQMFTIIDYDGSLSGTFSTFDTLVDSPAGADTIGLSIDYGSGTNDIVKLTVTSAPAPATAPEPSTLILAALGFVGLMGTRRRRRR